MRLSLRTKFYLLVAMLVLVVGGVLSSYFVRQLQMTVHHDLEQRARALAENLARNSEYGILLRSRPLLDGLIRSLLADEMILLVVVADADGIPLTQLGRPGQSTTPQIHPMHGEEVQIAADTGHGVFEVSAPVSTGEVKSIEGGLDAPPGTYTERRHIGTVYLRVSYAEAEHAAHRLSLAALGITGLMVGLCLLAGIFLVQRIVNPLLELEAGTRHIAQGNLGYRVPVVGGDEIGKLASSFNAMAEEVQKSRQELDAYNRNLEQKVAEKTQILSLANRRLEEMNRLKSEFLANMSHELRTPLNAILGFTDLILDDQVGPVSDQQRNYLTTVHTSGQHLLNLINSILDLSKIEAGKMELFPEEFYVDDVVEFALNLVGPQAARKKIELAKDIQPGVKTISADQTKVQQILQNLLSNAVKFTPEGGRVTVRAVASGEGVQLAVKDTGVGIAPQDQQRIFRAFTQVDSSYTRRFEGTGLGLALVDHYARMHRGRVWVESELGKGSTFFVYLPNWQGEVAAEPGTGEPKAATAPGDNVLVIEDDPTARRILHQYLSDIGCEVRFAGHSSEVLAALRDRRPSLITLDVLLQGETGWNILSMLKGDPKTSDIPVLIISAVDERGIGCAFGVEDYLVKPVTRPQLLQRLQAMGLTHRGNNQTAEILIVDDHEEARLLLRKMLEEENVHVIEAAGGREAIEAAQVTVPDLVLLDLMMPDVSGFDVLQALRSNPSTRDVPVMIVTAKELTNEDLARLNGDVQALVRKASLTGREFAKEVRRVLESGTRVPEAVHA